jgi:dephospho-CoA kinase
MKLIGVTGGIGSGKSTICRYIESLGYDVYYSDDAAKYLVYHSPLKEDLIAEFGEEAFIYSAGVCVYNRQYIADIVFNDKDKLSKITSIFKGPLEEHFNEFKKDKDLIFYESAIIFEIGITDRFDKIICTYADADDIIERIKNRDGFTEEQIKLRLDNQLLPEYKLSNSDYSVETTNLNEAYMVVDAILEQL